jgi:hypothetical protein
VDFKKDRSKVLSEIMHTGVHVINVHVDVAIIDPFQLTTL